MIEKIASLATDIRLTAMACQCDAELPSKSRLSEEHYGFLEQAQYKLQEAKELVESVTPEALENE